MQRKTTTTLNELRIGDRFVYPGGNVSYQVTAKADKTGKVAINQFANGKQVNRYDTLKRKTTTVLFLRHSIPLPQEECFIEDLQAGDIFCKPADIVHEYEIVNRGHEFYAVRRLDCASIEMAGRLATVIFIRKKEGVIK